MSSAGDLRNLRHRGSRVVWQDDAERGDAGVRGRHRAHGQYRARLAAQNLDRGAVSTCSGLVASHSAYAEERTIAAHHITAKFDTSDFDLAEVSEEAAKPAAPLRLGFEVCPASLAFRFDRSDAGEKLSGVVINIYPLRDRRRSIAVAFPDFPGAILVNWQSCSRNGRSSLCAITKAGARTCLRLSKGMVATASSAMRNIWISRGAVASAGWGNTRMTCRHSPSAAGSITRSQLSIALSASLFPQSASE